MSQVGERGLPKPFELGSIKYKTSNSFLRKIEQQFHQAQAYVCENTLENARRVIPRKTLLQRTIKKLRTIQKASKKDPKIDQVDVEDLFLVELSNWFKSEFFEWVDAPFCDYCGNKTEFSHVENIPEDKFSSRSEIFKCSACQKNTSFPRYNDVNILLETRKGRCGEWANAFTLICWALDFEARLVVDSTDHVWTEVYSRFQKRWLHCDPCENVCDNPLMYEHGWKKNLSYVIAYSPFEIQDVTWRYTSNFKQVLRRRTNCSEIELVRTIFDLRNDRLSKLSKARGEFIRKRTILELAEFLTERQPGDEMFGGRTSGSLDWRIARGDIGDTATKSYSFKLTFPLFSKLEYSMKYCCSSDRYVHGTDLELQQWSQGTYVQENMMRKVEQDWNKVYLCRKERTERGSIGWMFDLVDTNVRIKSVYVKLQSQTFENGDVKVAIIGRSSDEQKGTEIGLPPGNELQTMAFEGFSKLSVRAEVFGGRGSNAFQHAQLFRQDFQCDTEYFPFEIFLTLEKL